MCVTRRRTPPVTPQDKGTTHTASNHRCRRMDNNSGTTNPPTKVPWAPLMALCGASVLIGTTSAHAGEFCVQCSEPAAQYRCAISQGGALTTPPGGGLPCIRELARQGGHKTCAIRRNDPAACDGKLLVLAPDPNSQIPPNSPLVEQKPPSDTQADAQQGTDPINSDQVQDEQALSTKEAPDAAPKTVEELAKKTYESSQENLATAGRVVVDTASKTGGQIQNAGEFVGDAAQTTWTCITSLFSDCSSKANTKPPPAPDVAPPNDPTLVEPPQ